MAEQMARKVLHLSGKDIPGTLSDFCALLAESGARLVHLSQSSVHGCLVVNAEILEGNSTAEMKSSSFAKARNMHFDITRLAETEPAARGCGVWVTVLGDLSSAHAIATVGGTLREAGLILTRVESIGDGRLVGVQILAESDTTLANRELSALRSTLLGLCQALKVDLAVQRDDVYRTSKRLLCMDVDSTFVKGEFIDELAELAGVKAEVAEITARAMRGELDFEQALRERVKLLRGLPMSRARELCDRFELSPGAEELVRTVKQLGMRVGLVSGGFDFFVEMLKDRFELDFAFANELEVENEVLTGNVTGTIVDSKRKAQVLKDMAHVFGIRLEQTVAAGDGANDIEMLKAAGLGIAYQAKPRLQEIADTRFNESDRLDTLLYLMGFDAAKIVRECSR
jgi:phosphoserine phosphatase